VATRVTVSWPATGSYTLQQNGNLATSGGWATSGYSISTANGTNSITITSATGKFVFLAVLKVVEVNFVNRRLLVTQCSRDQVV
jgi:hypothetical protein